MKKTIQTISKVALAALVLATVSCRTDNDHPEDVHEHEEANKMIVTYTEEGTSNVETVEWMAGEDHDHAHKIANSETEEDHALFHLENGKSYDVTIQFYHDEENITPEIIEEAEHHFMEFGFAGINVNVERSSGDIPVDDENKLGLITKWTVNSEPVGDAEVQVQLIHGAASIDDDANNGGGSHTGGEEDVNAIFDVQTAGVE